MKLIRLRQLKLSGKLENLILSQFHMLTEIKRPSSKRSSKLRLKYMARIRSKNSLLQSRTKEWCTILSTCKSRTKIASKTRITERRTRRSGTRHATMLRRQHAARPWLKMKDSTRWSFRKFLISELPRSWIAALIFSPMVDCKVVSPRSQQLVTWSQLKRLGIESALGTPAILSKKVQRQLQTSRSQTWISKRMLSSVDHVDWTLTWLGHLSMLKLLRQNRLPSQPLSQLVKSPWAGEAELLQTMCQLLHDPPCKASQAHKGLSAQVVSKSWGSKLSNEDELKFVRYCRDN